MSDAKERYLWRYKPENRLQALLKYYGSDELAHLTVRGKPALALLRPQRASIPYSAFQAEAPMIVVYGYWPEEDDYDFPGAIGYVTLSRLEKIPKGKGVRVRSLSLDRWTTLNAGQVERLRDLANGTVARPGLRSRISPLAARVRTRHTTGAPAMRSAA